MEAAVTFYDEHGFPTDMPAIVDISWAFKAAFAHALENSRGNIFSAISHPLGMCAIKIVRPSYENPEIVPVVIDHLSARFYLGEGSGNYEVVSIHLIPSKSEMARLLNAEYARLHQAGILTRFFNWLTKAA